MNLWLAQVRSPRIKANAQGVLDAPESVVDLELFEQSDYRGIEQARLRQVADASNFAHSLTKQRQR